MKIVYIDLDDTLCDFKTAYLNAPSVSLVVQLAISPEFNQLGAAWEHSCHAIPKNVKPQC